MISVKLNAKNAFLNSLETEWGMLDIRKNKEYKTKSNNENSFLFWPYYLDIDRKDSAELETYIAQIRELLSFLKTKGMNVVAACDFESEL